MTGPFCKRTVLAVVFLLTALMVVVPPSASLAAQAPTGQTVQAPPVTRTDTSDDDDSGKWGLLGLVGLAGLLRRDRPRSVTVVDRPDH
jgi:MYXO-CTERM domain-containing protein